MTPFLARQRLSRRILNSLPDLSAAVLACDAYELMNELTAKRVVAGRPHVPDMFTSYVKSRSSYLTKPEHFEGRNEIVRMKLVHHFEIKVLSDFPADDWMEAIKTPYFSGMVEELMDDFGDGEGDNIRRIVGRSGIEKSACPE